MNKHQEIRDALAALIAEPSHDGSLSIPASLLEQAVMTIDTWKMIGEEFAQSITVTPGEVKPRIAVDIERFLAAQYTYNQEADGLQQGI